MDNPTHKLDAYQSDRVWVTFCKVCSREGDLLAEPCPGKYVSVLDKEVDNPKEQD